MKRSYLAKLDKEHWERYGQCTSATVAPNNQDLFLFLLFCFNLLGGLACHLAFGELHVSKATQMRNSKYCLVGNGIVLFKI